MIKIALDVMGGDNSPQAGVQAAATIVKHFHDIELILFGDQAQIDPLLDDHDRISLVHCSQVITGDDEPTTAIRQKKDASMVVACQYVKEGQADAILSTGNTGALLTAATLIIGRIKNVQRPALLATLPVLDTSHNNFVMTDVGANAENKAKFLHQFAYFGKFYAEYVMKIKNPRLALLNNGSEESKGNELTKEVHQILAEDQNLNFIGNIEGGDILKGDCDVVVADGFTGNAVLKTVEGTAMQVIRLMSNSIKAGNLKTKLGGLLIQDSLRSLVKEYVSDEIGGAVFMGVKAPVVITHGAADETAILMAASLTRDIVQSGLIGAATEFFENNK